MKVLIATDGSPASTHAIHEALRLLPLQSAEVKLVSVATLPPVGLEPMGYALPAYPLGSPVLQEAFELSHQGLEEGRRLLSAAGIEAETIESQGDPATEILRLAREQHVDLIVLGSHGRNPLEKLFLGSVADAVVRRHKGAVLVVRPS